MTGGSVGNPIDELDAAATALSPKQENRPPDNRRAIEFSISDRQGDQFLLAPQVFLASLTAPKLTTGEVSMLATVSVDGIAAAVAVLSA